MATAGDTHLGGEDFDSALVDWVSDQHRRANKDGKDPFSGDGSEMAKRKLRNACESAKRELSSASKTIVELSAGGEEISVELTRAKFEQLNERTFQRCLDSVKRVLGDAKVGKEDVHEVVLVGGSTRVPRVQAILSEFFGGKALCRSVNPDEAVAFGAAVQGAILSGVRDPLTQSLLLVDVTPLSLGVGCEGHKFARVVPRNTQIPCKMTSEFTTVHDNQTTIEVDVLEGESPNSRDNHLLGSFDITGVERAKQGVPKIDVTFDVNTNGLLTVSARDKVTGAKANVEIQHDRGRLTQEEIARMCEEAERMRVAMEEQQGEAEEGAQGMAQS
jgi:heat shock 70kDa protein 1/6/8